MRIYDIIAKKRDGLALSEEEIRFFVSQYTQGMIPDYQASALLMAICINGMDRRETTDLTMAMAASGDQVDLSGIGGAKADKHSTGGVGDKTTLVVAPVVASLGVKMAKMSGRGLGHTGGTLDKLEAIPGFQVELDREKFIEIVNRVGCCVIGQTGNLAPADKKLYALRDVTATVESIPLIASSVMSKKLAAGADCILLDVKTGSGAFMKRAEDAAALAREMVGIGTRAGRKTAALITNMDRPLGNRIGNALEVMEAVQTLQGPEDLTELCLNLCAGLLVLSGKGGQEECCALARKQLGNGEAFRKLKEMVKAQGGDESALEDFSRLPQASFRKEVFSSWEGFLTHMDTRLVGAAAAQLGAGRERKGDAVDYGAGIELHKKPGDFVRKGDSIATLLTSRKELLSPAADTFCSALSFDSQPPEKEPLIYARVTGEGTFPVE
jgi:pyrimidine-nucleoside phosphorylase